MTPRPTRPELLACAGRTLPDVGGPRATAAEVSRTRLWVLPNPSGLNAHYQLDRLTALFADLRGAVGLPPGSTAERHE